MKLEKYPFWLKSLVVAAACAVVSPGPHGLGLAAILLFGYGMAVPAAVGITLNWYFRGIALPLAAVGAVLRGGELILIAALLRRLPAFDFRFSRVRGVLGYTILTLGVGAGSTLGLSWILMTFGSKRITLLYAWDIFWIGNVAAFLILTPIVLILATSVRVRRTPREYVEFGGLLAAAALLSYWGLPLASTGGPVHPVSILLVALLFWLAMRFRQIGAVTGALVLLGASVIQFSGWRTLIQMTITGDMLDRVLMIGIAGLSSLMLAAGLSESFSTEEKFLVAFQNSPDGMSISTLDGRRLIEANPTFLNFLGLRREDAINKSAMELNIWLDTAQRDCLVQQIKLQGAVRAAEVEVRDAQGKARTVEVSGARIELHGEPCLLLTSRDITDTKRAEEALRQSRQITARLSLAFQQSPAPMCIVRASDARIAEVNDSFVNFYGAPREEIVGRTSTELNAWVDASQREHIRSQVSEKGGVHDFEVTLRTRSGELRTVLWNGDLVQAEGEPWVHVTLNDITFEKLAQKALQDSELKYRELFENANDFLFTLDFGGNFLSINRKGETLIGLSAIDAMSKKLEDLVQPSSRDAFLEQFASVVRGDEPEVVEVTLNTEQAPAPVLEVAMRLVRKDDQAFAVQGIGRDITERRVLEKKFLQAQKMEAVGTLAGGIAHDFNNLLTVMTGYAHLVKDQLPAESALRADVDEIDRAASRAASLTRQLLTFSRQRVTRRVPLDLNDSLRSMEKMLRRLLGVNIQLSTQLEQGLPRVFADPAQIDQVIMNLAVNSRDAMPNGGKLEFRTQRVEVTRRDVGLGLASGYYVVISVTDTGIGMDEDTQSRVFEPFYTTKDVGKGTGLGLSTVYGIIQDCGGYIGVSSQLGRGTVFTIYLPASKAEAVAEALARQSSTRGHETILLVEDDAAIRSLAAKILESSGYQVLTAGDAPQARRLLDDTRTTIDVMVTDVMIPGGSGPELGRHAEVVRPAMKSFYISGHAAGKVPPGAILLQKPFSPIELAVQIRTLLDHPENSPSEGHS